MTGQVQAKKPLEMPLETADISKDDVSLWWYTSGSTGLPEGTVHLHHGLVYGAFPQLTTELQQFAKAKITCYNYPRWIEYLSELPKMATGKTQRYKLRAQ